NSPDSQVTADSRDKTAVELGKAGRLGIQIERLQPLGDFIKIWRPMITMPQSLAVGQPPVCPVDFCIPDGLMVSALGFDGNGQPLHAVRCFDLVAITPVAPGVLHVII